jgi:purine nucleoside permease
MNRRTAASLRLLAAAIPIALAAALGFSPKARGGPSTPQVKVLIVTSTDAEATALVDSLALSTTIAVDGLAAELPPVRCNDAGVCLLVTGAGKARTAASVAAAVLSGALDLSRAYFVIAGLARIDPSEGTVGSVAWAKTAVDYGIAWELDARAIPSAWSTGYLGISATSPTDKPTSMFGTEVFALSAPLAEKAMALTKTTTLADAPAAQTYRAMYASPPATSAPSVLACDTTTSDTVWHGQLLGQRAHDWVALLTDGATTYCTMQQSANAAIEALQRGDKSQLDATRIAVVYAASAFDRPYPGQTAYDSLRADAGGGTISAQNLATVVSAFVTAVVDDWADWETGVPP